MRPLRTLLICLCLSPSLSIASERRSLDEQWRFHRGDAASAEQVEFDDANWRAVDLPHDWSIELPPQADAVSEGHGGYHETGIGWYRRQLNVADLAPGSTCRLEFEGVYHNAQVWINGQLLGTHSYGYTPFSFDITPYLKSGDDANLIAVRVDNSDQPNCRWYSGSGIYRHVWLRTLPPVYIEPSSVWVENSPAGPQSECQLHYTLVNNTDAPRTVSTEESITDSAGMSELTRTHKLEIGANKSTDVHRQVSSKSAMAWSPGSPELMQLRLRLLTTEDSANEVLDSINQSFGLRTVVVDAERGFLLNGKPVKLYGGNVHHDHGPLGAASFEIAEDRRVRLLKEAGFNAVRTSHNPPSEAFLDACDRHGLLVIDEFFDGWAKSKVARDYGPQFEKMWDGELTATIQRDRRHPSVVMWSIGNEVYERGDRSGQRLARELADRVRELDASRAVTIGLNGLGEDKWERLDPMFAAVDVCGYNYEPARYETDHARLPKRVMYASESYPESAFESYMAVQSHPYVIGDFVWSAIDYLGEAAIGRVFPPGQEPRKHWEGEHFPWRAAACGDIDLIGHRKPISHYRNIVWNRGEKLFLAVETPVPDGDQWQLTPWAALPCLDSWTWSVPEGTPLRVHAYSRFPRVRLLLNGREVGEAPTGETQEFRTVFEVPYEPGTLVLEGIEDGQRQQQVQLTTAGESTTIELLPECDTLKAGRQSIVFVAVRLTDQQGATQTQADRDLEFTVSGPAEIITVGNADHTSRRAYTNPVCPTFQGRALVVMRSTGETGAATLAVQGDGLSAGRVQIEFTSE